MHSTRYRVVVKGRFSDRMASAFGGVTLERSPGRTVLSVSGDREDLDAILERLRDLNIELVSVDDD